MCSWINVSTLYTQLVWATSRQVGCAVHRCKLIAKSNLSSEASYLVCHYGPAGNLPGVKPFIKGDYACSKCSSGAGWCWDEQLCDSECSSSRYNKCSCAAICLTVPRWIRVLAGARVLPDGKELTVQSGVRTRTRIASQIQTQRKESARQSLDPEHTDPGQHRRGWRRVIMWWWCLWWSLSLSTSATWMMHCNVETLSDCSAAVHTGRMV